jgi:hypothetical protein
MIKVSLTPGFNQVNRAGIESVTVSTVFINANKPLKRLWLSCCLCVPALKRGVNGSFANRIVFTIDPTQN